jgi:hypothetical protein
VSIRERLHFTAERGSDWEVRLSPQRLNVRVGAAFVVSHMLLVQLLLRSISKFSPYVELHLIPNVLFLMQDHI